MNIPAEKSPCFFHQSIPPLPAPENAVSCKRLQVESSTLPFQFESYLQTVPTDAMQEMFPFLDSAISVCLKPLEKCLSWD